METIYCELNKVNELICNLEKNNPSLVSIRIRVIAQLVDFHVDTDRNEYDNYFSSVYIKTLPDFDQHIVDTTILRLRVEEKLFDSQFTSPDGPHLFDPVDLRLSIWFNKGPKNKHVLEILNVKALSIKEVEVFRKFITSKEGEQFSSISKSL